MAVLGVIGIIALLVACSALQTWVHYELKDPTPSKYERELNDALGIPNPPRKKWF